MGEDSSSIIHHRVEGGDVGGGGEGRQWWWWAAGSGAQLGWGIMIMRRGYAGECRMMPLKAFGVASLFVGSAASASFSALKAYGINKVEDVMVLGANIRTGLGIPPRARDK